MLFVTGITGHTGYWFLKRLIDENYSGKIRCLVLDECDTQQLDNSGLNIEVIRGSLEDKQLLESSLSGVDTVVHIASIYYSDNIAEAALANNVKWLIMVHTTGRFSKYKSASAEYIEIEDRILSYRNQIGITILRPTMIYGSSLDRNMYKLVDYLYRHKFFPMFGQGNNLMQPVHAKDLGNAYYSVLVNEDKTYNRGYNLPGREAISYYDLVRTVSAALQRRNIIVKIPLWMSVFAARLYNILTKKALISVEQVLRMQEDKDFSYCEAAEDFQYDPLPFVEGIKDEVNEYLNQLKECRHI